MYKKFRAGNLVKDRRGGVHEVIAQNGCQVWTGANEWHHPSNLTLVRMAARADIAKAEARS